MNIPITYNLNNYRKIRQLANLSAQDIEDIAVVAQVFPFKVNAHVVNNLIDWSLGTRDPIFRMTFPHREMLSPENFATIATLVRNGASRSEIAQAAARIRQELNPNQADQLTRNVPSLDGQPLRGIQHKYSETVLYFPAEGQNCHAWCTFCFRWPQFVSSCQLFASHDPADLTRYLDANPHITDVLFTGGDPLSMSTQLLKSYINPLLRTELSHVRNIRIGSKLLSWWPQRFTQADDSSELLHLCERIVRSGRSLTLVAHLTHPRELSHPLTREACRLLLSTGAQIRAQCALLKGINDDPRLLSELWRAEVTCGCLPYYLFIERDTGAKCCFETPLLRAWQIYRDAIANVSGLARSVRGPVMSCTPGKVCLHGVLSLDGPPALALEYIQARDPALVGRPFLAAYDERATWWNQLRPYSPAYSEFFPQ